MRKPKVCILRSAGTNCDQETAAAFLLAGASAERLHINRLIDNKRTLDNFHILALPGGFSYGDDIASGKIFANELRFKLIDSLRKFIADGKLIIGICNGFQILVKSGLLPGDVNLNQTTSLIINDSGKFESRWVYLKSSVVHRPSSVKCVWVKDLPEVIYLPVAHGEGKFVVGDKQILNRLKANNQIVFQYSDAAGKISGYPDNPNGSMENIAGISDEAGRVFGLMPHPERYIFSAQHPRKDERKKEADGLQIFKNGVNFIKKNF